MAKLYGWGASVVILGALFKINHYPYADYMLILGLGTESIIFFFSGFEQPHVEPDWSLVYPELAGMYHGINQEVESETTSTGSLTGDLDKMLGEAKIGPELIDRLGQGLRSLSENTSNLRNITDATVATDEYTHSVRTAATSVGKLNESYKKKNEVMDEDEGVSKEYLESVKNASGSVTELSQTYGQISESMKKDLSATDEFAESVKSASDSAKNLAENYNKSASKLSESAEALDFTSLKEINYADELQKVSQKLASLNSTYDVQLQNSKAQADSSARLQETLEKFLGAISGSIDNTGKYDENIKALNNIYEKQLQGTSSQVESTEKLRATLDGFLGKIQDSADKTLKYNEELDNLAKKVEALNTVYGNMLTALNVKTQ